MGLRSPDKGLTVPTTGAVKPAINCGTPDLMRDTKQHTRRRRQHALAHVPLLDDTWLVSCPVLPTPLQGELLRLLLVVGVSQPLWFHQILQGPGCLDQAVEWVLKLMRGEAVDGVQGVPRWLSFTEKPLLDALVKPVQAAHRGVQFTSDTVAPTLVHDTLDDITAKLGIKEITDRINPLRRSPQAFATCMWPVPTRNNSMPIVSVRGVPLRRPTDDTYGGCPLEAFPLLEDRWQKALERLAAKAMLQASEALAGNPALARRYFGRAAHRDQLLTSPVAPYASRALLDWIWLDHRKRRSDDSLAEQLLPELTDPQEREVLKSLLNTTHSLHRVVRVYPSRCVVLEDILQDYRLFEVHDRRLSLLLPPNVVISARVFPVEATHVVSAPGPVIPPSHVLPALDFIHRQGLKTTPKALQAGAHLFGRLWHWRSWQHLPEHLFNTEGEELVVYRAAFHVADETAVENVLQSHPEIEPLEEAGRYAWAAYPAPASTDQTAVRAWLQVRDGTLRLLATSVSRWLYLHDLLVEIPGVELAWISLVPAERWLQTFGDLDALLGDGAVTGQVHVPDKDPVVRRLNLTWLSVRNPYLGGLTPRDVGGTRAGWRKVKQLVRCLLPSIRDIDGLANPKDASQVWSIWDSVRRDEWVVQDRIMQAVWADD